MESVSEDYSSDLTIPELYLISSGLKFGFPAGGPIVKSFKTFAMMRNIWAST